MKALGAVLVVVLSAVAAAGAILLIGMRRKSPLVLGAVKQLNKRLSNPAVMKTAGSEGASAGVIRHVGRSSGQTYETPIGPFATDDGFVVALPYGASTDWCRNVLAAGSAEIVDEGRTSTVVDPEVVPSSEVVQFLPDSEVRTIRRFGVSEFLRVRTVDDPASV